MELVLSGGRRAIDDSNVDGVLALAAGKYVACSGYFTLYPAVCIDAIDTFLFIGLSMPEGRRQQDVENHEAACNGRVANYSELT